MATSSIEGSTTTPSTTTTSPITNTGTTSSTEATIPITTTFTSSSLRCVATLEAQVLPDGATGLVISAGSFITLNNTCHTLPTSMVTRTNNATHSIFPSSSRALSASSSASSSPSPRTGSGISGGMIAGLVLGVIAIVGCFIGAGFWLWLRRRRNNTTVFTAKAKMLEEDRSGEVPIRWEKDSSEIKESDCAEIKEMSAGPLPVEMGDGRSIVEPDDSTPLSPISINTRDSRDSLYGYDAEGIVSPLSPKGCI